MQSKLVAFFAPDFTEVSTITRARGFLEHGLTPVVFAFRRGRYNPAFKSPWREIDLGRTVDGRYLDRALKMFAALPIIWRNRVLLRQAVVFYARNLDQLMLASAARLLVGGKARLYYEVLDVARAFTRPGLLAAVMRFLERRLLRRLDAIVVSSPAFLQRYYAPIQGYGGRAFLIENRLHASDVAIIEGSPAAASLSKGLRRRYKWVIGYFGLIRGERTLELITGLAERFPDILFYFRGVVTTIDPRKFEAVIAAHDNMIYGGAYVNPDDLKQLYSSVDLTWAIDLEHEDYNSRWLLPCRLYESGIIGVPCLAARGFEAGEHVERLGIGWTVEPPYGDSLARLFARLAREEYDVVVDRLAALPLRSFVMGEDMAKLCRAIAGEEKESMVSRPPPIRVAFQPPKEVIELRSAEESSPVGGPAIHPYNPRQS